MRPTVFQRAELRDENDNIIQQGTYGKGSALSNSTNDGWVDYVMNNLEALRSMSVGAIIPVETLPESGETGKAYVVTTGTDAGKLFMWDGEDWVEITGSIGDYLPITGGTITGNLAVAGISTAVTPAVDDNSTKVATTEYVQNEVKPIETDVDIAEKDIANIKALLQGHLYNYQTDSTSAYTKSVPAGALPYAGLEKVGGKTIVWNQLVNSGTTSVATISGRKYYTLIDGTASIVTSSGSSISIVDDTADMVCDLTLMFGIGNEPSTTADFTAIFGATHYSYNAGTLLSAGATEVVSKDSNNATLQTYSIPASIQALEGYGWSAGSVYNYIDFERKVFVKRVGRVDFGTLTFGYNPNVQIFSFTMPSDSKAVALGGIQAVSARYININGTTSQWRAQNMVMTVNNGYESNAKSGYIKDSNYTDANALKTSLSGQYLYYELDTPVETDISAYITDDNLIQVESGGTLTFENQHGDDYRLPVPSTEEYMIDLQSALGE